MEKLWIRELSLNLNLMTSRFLPESHHSLHFQNPGELLRSHNLYRSNEHSLPTFLPVLTEKAEQMGQISVKVIPSHIV